MAIATEGSLATLYVEDETAWLDAMVELIRQGDLASLDLDNLAEYLTDMAKRDRREVKSRLVVLLTHLLKWEFQPAKRTASWRTTMLDQRQELQDLVGRGVLRNHAETVLEEAYQHARSLAASETSLPKGSFPQQCPNTLKELLAIELPEGEIAN